MNSNNFERCCYGNYLLRNKQASVASNQDELREVVKNDEIHGIKSAVLSCIILFDTLGLFLIIDYRRRLSVPYSHLSDLCISAS